MTPETRRRVTSGGNSPTRRHNNVRSSTVHSGHRQHRQQHQQSRSVYSGGPPGCCAISPCSCGPVTAASDFDGPGGNDGGGRGGGPGVQRTLAETLAQFDTIRLACRQATERNYRRLEAKTRLRLRARQLRHDRLQPAVVAPPGVEMLSSPVSGHHHHPESPSSPSPPNELGYGQQQSSGGAEMTSYYGDYRKPPLTVDELLDVFDEIRMASSNRRNQMYNGRISRLITRSSSPHSTGCRCQHRCHHQ